MPALISMKSPNSDFATMNPNDLDRINVPQERILNQTKFKNFGGIEELIKALHVNIYKGLSDDQVKRHLDAYGTNHFPEPPQQSFISLLLEALQDTTLIILIIAAVVSIILGVILENPEIGWIEGFAILVAVFLVSVISAGNDYSKELQFRSLQKISHQADRCSVLRDGNITRISPDNIVVGDILVLQSGDMVPADCVLLDSNVNVGCDESSLTGEVEVVKKSPETDCFLLSSCLIAECDSEVKALVIAVGLHSQWGKIKSSLDVEQPETPLQVKLAGVVKLLTLVGVFFAFATFIALMISIWVKPNGLPVATNVVRAFLLAITIIVVAIPEGLPLAVTIALAYSNKRMYKENCFIRQLAACETMGNATNICTDKTGTLTENRMTVVEGWFCDVNLNQDQFQAEIVETNLLTAELKQTLAHHISVNRSAYYAQDAAGGGGINHIHSNLSTSSSSSLKNTIYSSVSRHPEIIGSKTEASLLNLVSFWGFDPDLTKASIFNEKYDKVFAFNSIKKRSTSIIQLNDGKVRLYCKGASEYVLKSCTKFSNSSGEELELVKSKRAQLHKLIENLARNALRTLVLAHKDFRNAEALPFDWMTNPPDEDQLCCDAIVGIMDPLRSDVKEAVSLAQRAGVVVRMVTGDHLSTATAIAKQCGILGYDGVCIEGPEFRKLSPQKLDELLPRLRVIARSSPDDKRLLVVRLNGHHLPKDKESWLEAHPDLTESQWESWKDMVLPGYEEEWKACHPQGGEVVGVTGDGTNDAPALKAADVGLSMGITGTKVAQEASDIVILDDKFSSIVNAILWGRCIYDNIRKFLQFQVTVNLAALVLVFGGAVTGKGSPITAIQMLWVNLVMDSLAALALATEGPTHELLDRRPYKRSAPVFSRPMLRNVLVQATLQLILTFTLLFNGAKWFGVSEAETCHTYTSSSGGSYYNVLTLQKTNTTTFNAFTPTVNCGSFKSFCPDQSYSCYSKTQLLRYGDQTTPLTAPFTFSRLNNYESDCLTCEILDHTLYTLIFNTFIFCQIFNMFVSRHLLNEINMFSNLHKSPMFMVIIAIIVGLQVILTQAAGEGFQTTPLTASQWFITVALGALTLPVGVLMRFIPIKEDPNTFANNENESLLPTMINKGTSSYRNIPINTQMVSNVGSGTSYMTPTEPLVALALRSESYNVTTV